MAARTRLETVDRSSKGFTFVPAPRPANAPACEVDVLFVNVVCGSFAGMDALGVGFLRSVLERSGYVTRELVLKQPALEDGSWRALMPDPLPRMIGFSVNYQNEQAAAHLAAELRRMAGRPEVALEPDDATAARPFLVAGGPQVNLRGEDFLVKSPSFDAACLGEGEPLVLELIRRIDDGRPLDASIPGLVYRRGGAIVANARAQDIDLDSLPFPLYDQVGPGAPYPLVTSRACPYDCVFCMVKVIYGGRKWRYRTADSVVAELKEVSRRGIREIAIQDDCFNTSVPRAKEIFRGILRERLDLDLIFPNGIRADLLDDELVSLMKQAGTVRAPFGVENLDPETKHLLGKSLKFEKLQRAAELFKRHGLRSEAFMIIGLPETDYASVMRSLSELKRAGVEVARWYVAYNYEGTAMDKWVREHGRPVPEPPGPKNPWSARPPMNFDTAAFPAEERMRAFFKCNAESNNFLVLGYEENESAARALVYALARIAKYSPRSFPAFARYALHAVVDFNGAVFNEPRRSKVTILDMLRKFRFRSRASVRSVEPEACV
jgi:hypothetical protein